MTTYLSPDLPGYEPGPCPDCGSSNVKVTAIKAESLAGPTTWTPGKHRCLDCRNLQR